MTLSASLADAGFRGRKKNNLVNLWQEGNICFSAIVEVQRLELNQFSVGKISSGQVLKCYVLFS